MINESQLACTNDLLVNENRVCIVLRHSTCLKTPLLLIKLLDWVLSIKFVRRDVSGPTLVIDNTKSSLLINKKLSGNGFNHVELRNTTHIRFSFTSKSFAQASRLSFITVL